MTDYKKIYDMMDKHAFWVSFNMNDTFSWATSEGEDIAIEDLPKLAETYEKFGSDGINAFAAMIRGYDVMDHPEVRTEQYYAAKEFLRGYEFRSDEYQMRKYREAHPEETKKRIEEQKEYYRQQRLQADKHNFTNCLSSWFERYAPKWLLNFLG